MDDEDEIVVRLESEEVEEPDARSVRSRGGGTSVIGFKLLREQTLWRVDERFESASMLRRSGIRRSIRDRGRMWITEESSSSSSTSWIRF